jgi:hypothetical protein
MHETSAPPKPVGEEDSEAEVVLVFYLLAWGRTGAVASLCFARFSPFRADRTAQVGMHLLIVMNLS